MEKAWNIRYRFRTSQRIDLSQSEIVLQLGTQSASLRSRTGGPLNETNDLMILAQGLSSEDSAFAFGYRLRHALLAASALSAFGLDIGKDETTSSVGRAVKDEILANHGIAIRDDVHGLAVYPSEPPSTFPRIQARGAVHVNPDSFVKLLETSFKEKILIPDILLLPIDLYCASCMERSHVAKFIIAMSAIEAIAGRSRRPPSQLALLEQALNSVDHAVGSKEDKDSVRQALNHFQNVSISQSCRNLISEQLPEKSDLFKDLSELRGKIAHPHSDRSELPEMAFRAELLVAELITKILRRSAIAGDA